MKITKRLSFFILALILLLSFAACGAQSKSSAADSAAGEMSPQYATNREEAGGPEAEMPASEEQSSSLSQGTVNSDKIIYSGSATVETMEFDKSLEALAKLIEGCGGFVQSSGITGNDFNTTYYGGKSYRRADYTLRIPVGKFSAVTEALDTLGNVSYTSTNAENVTMQYRDTQSKLNSRRTEETRLLELLAKADTVEDMLKIESYLSDVRYEIESLESSIKNWDSLISYSTLSLTINEVTVYSEDEPATLSYGQQLSNAFTSSIRAVGRFFKDFFKLFVAALPVLVILGVLAVIIVVIVKLSLRRKKTKQDRQDNQNK